MKPFIYTLLILLLGINAQAATDPDSLNKVRILYNEAKFSSAIDACRELINNHPHDTEAYLNLAYIYKDLAEYDQALGLLNEALELSQDERLRMLLANIYYLNANPKRAISEFNKLISDGYNNSEILFYLGLCFEELGKLSKARSYYSQALEIEPGHVLARLKLAGVFYAQKKFEQAQENYKAVALLDPSITDVYHKLAICSVSVGKLEQAYKQYAKCVAIYPEDKVLRKELKEVKKKLGEDFFKKRAKAISAQRKKKSAQVKDSPFAKVSPQFKVGLTGIETSVGFKCGCEFEIISKESNKIIFTGAKESPYALVFDKEKGINLEDEQGNILLAGLTEAIFIKNKIPGCVITVFNVASGIGNFWARRNDLSYRGIIEVALFENGLSLINLINLEEYLYGVLPSEMPSKWPEQALCAQAIAARTWAIRNEGRHKRDGFNFCSGVHCQVYKGVLTETQFTNQAVDETAGLVVFLNDQPPDIFYSSNCGGSTRDGVVDAITEDFIFPLSPLELENWLMTDPSAFCNLGGQKNVNFRWQRIYSYEQLQELLDNVNIDVGKIISVIPRERAISAHLRSIKIQGMKRDHIINGENKIRKIFGKLRSSAFKIAVKYTKKNQPGEFMLYGGGFGHARGLCQAGMKGMALDNYEYQEILRHYYPGIEIKNIIEPKKL